MDILIYCSQRDEPHLKRRRLNTIPLKINFRNNFISGHITPIPTAHGYGVIGKFMGRGTGYFIEPAGDKTIYLSGDTEAVPEMLALKDIDVAFVCMTLPYTMDIEQAAGAVRAFKPAIVYPYHYRGADLEQFKKLVGTDAGVEVRIRDWYGGTR